jgi:hypothetical protein
MLVMYVPDVREIERVENSVTRISINDVLTLCIQ